MTLPAIRRIAATGLLAAPTLAVSVTTLGPWVTGLLALVAFCTAVAVWRMTVAAIYGDVARMDAAAAKAAAVREASERAEANRAFYDKRGATR